MLFYHLKTGNNVLIDTWWNVNENTIVQEIDLSSFNRYMVECEFGSYANLRTIRHGFNRYMVECELLWAHQYNKRVSVLIDTWWNVNSTRARARSLSDLVLIDTWWNVNIYIL